MPTYRQDAEPPVQLREESWATLVQSILNDGCTPFLGAGIAYGHLPTGKEVAQDLAVAESYPFEDNWNLPRVAEYVETMHDDTMYAKRWIRDYLRVKQDQSRRATGGPPENYQILARIGFSRFITTNYDDLLVDALVAEHASPVIEACRWNGELTRQLGAFPEHAATPLAPIVFHLHGRMEQPETILLSESDYVDFMVSLVLGSDQVSGQMIWPAIVDSLSSDNLLFIGYSLADWNFRVLLRYLLQQYQPSRRRTLRLSIQLDPDSLTGREEDAREFFIRNFGVSNIRFLAADAVDFLRELDTRVSQQRAQLARS
jgi:hypothetical protein